MSELQQAVERLRRMEKGELMEDVYNVGIWGWDMIVIERRNDKGILAKAYLAEHAPKPLEAYLEFANVLCVEDAWLGYDAAVALAKAMHKRGMVIPNE